MIKKIIALLSFSFILGACSSGTSVSDLPPNLGGAPFTGTFQSSQNRDSGNITFNLTQDGSNITGLFIVNRSSRTCLRSGPVDGTINGFNVNLEIEQTASSTTTTGTGDSQTQTTQGGGTLRMALTATNTTLNGSYTVVGDTNGNCSVDSSTGTISVSR